MEGTFRRALERAVGPEAPLRSRRHLEPRVPPVRDEIMKLTFGTPAWADALKAEINASSEYRNAAAKWGDGFNGNVLLVFDADAAAPNAHALLVELEKGSCHGAAFV